MSPERRVIAPDRCALMSIPLANDLAKRDSKPRLKTTGNHPAKSGQRALSTYSTRTAHAPQGPAEHGRSGDQKHGSGIIHATCGNVSALDSPVDSIEADCLDTVDVNILSCTADQCNPWSA